ncbi:molybdopterin-synthase adenylyltransferase MoeB [Shewanella violacea]|uniref:Molybdopterin-synthase adenylyltransferase n=1 Tax=Shewanella violacea (strain JCM 10179 / CIP 106290 / LMG 19151 / DSS12) TaxID=637905 RepID=D4ZJP5_SHEVD|nr:molybdopterin-synthase adenylyltransferase MoeB [Shewanella violacea]BAJ01894.1 molybdenum cofactor biosynthesis protein [Shewanella violacea DSS12]
MKMIIKIPSPLRRFTDNNKQIELDALTVKDALIELFKRYPDIKPQILDDTGNLRNFVNLYHNKVDIRQQEGLDTKLQSGSEIRIVPAIAGGSSLDTHMSANELSRYSRHILLPEIGVPGQQALKNASILIIGAGGLGCPLALYLAAAGVGHLGLVDDDVVEESNLQRQVLFSVDDIGQSKVDAAKRRLERLNPHINITSYPERLTADNALKIMDNYDIIIDGTDNFPTRYLVNDACVLLNKPNIYGSIFRFDGQTSVFNYQAGPCYRCLYPEPPPPGLVPSCAEGGVLGVLPSIIASIQATEAIKMITNIGDSLSGRLVLYDALALDFEFLLIKRDPACPICGENPTITQLMDYQAFCGLSQNTDEKSYKEIEAKELKAWMDREQSVILIDVREPFEREICMLAGSQFIPMQDIDAHIPELDPNKELVFYCKMGGRSAKVCAKLTKLGFNKVTNLKGGILAWIDKVDQSLTRY